MNDPLKGVTQRDVIRDGRRDVDEVAVEEPLEIRVDGESVAVTMRTPGDDERLALGFLFSEGIVRSAADVTSISRCGRPDEAHYGNTIEVRSGPGVSLEVERLLNSRNFTMTSACGVCGRKSIDDLLERCPPIDRDIRMTSDQVAAAMDALRAAQKTFARTGGSHAAGLFAKDRELLASYEDVGRHNAVDKAIGALVMGGRLADAALLAVSGRASFEIVQKAAMARIPIVASVSAPSSLAIDVALRMGITLVGFVRAGSLNVYAGGERLT